MKKYLVSLCCLPLFVGLLSTVAMAAAPPARKAYGHLSVAMPTGWKASEEGSMVTLQSNDEMSSVFITALEVKEADATGLAQERATIWEEEDSALILPDERGFILSTKSTRCWFVVAGGWMLEIGVSRNHRDIRGIIESLDENPKSPGPGQALAVLKAHPDIEAWLSFQADLLPSGSPLPRALVSDMPDFSSYGAIAGENGSPPPALNKLPQGWSTTTVGMWTVSTSADNSQWAALRLYPVAEGDMALEDGSPPTETAKKLVALLGGSNVISAEGSIQFDLPFGMAIIESKRGNYILIAVYSDEHTASELFLLQ